jgi:urease accessory protein
MQMHTFRKVALTATLGLALAPIAFAHTGHLGSHNGLAQGMLHPWTGLDHMLAMVTVGLWAALRRGRMMWGLPLAFMLGMTLGGVLGINAVALPGVENGIAASVLVLGLAVAVAAMRVPAIGALALVALSGMFHGHAHGAEMAAGAGAAVYTIGMLASTASLHATGLGLMTLALRHNWMLKAARAASGVIAACGLAMLVGLI